MSKSVNKVILLGNVGQQPETKNLSKTGTLLTTISLATNERVKSGDEWKDRTEWHTVLFYGRIGEIARDYLRKGSKVYVEGRIRTDKWEDDGGGKHYRTYIVAHELALLDSHNGNRAPEPSEDFAPATKTTPKTEAEKYYEEVGGQCRSNDLGILFAAFGVSVQFNGSTAQGILDQPEVIRLADRGFGGVESVNYSLKLPFNAFSPMPVTKDALVVDGQNYTVIERTAQGDGAIVAYDLKGPIA